MKTWRKKKKSFKIDIFSMKTQKPHEETIDIVENISQSNHEIKEEQLKLL